MAIKNVQQLLADQLGKARVDAIATTAMTGKDYGIIVFTEDSVVASITATNVQEVAGSTATNLVKSYSENAVLFLDVTAITLTSGKALCYYNEIV
tara:strand:+ start:214 stop:498 length:285 start_codon:yes stop_codon:yes gene_type:complete